MPVTNEQVAALRAQLTGDQEEHLRLYSQIEASGDLVGYAALLGAAFVVATERHFQPPVTRADLIRYVADVRARTPEAGEKVEPKAAEQLLYEALANESFTGDPRLNGAHQTIFLAALVADAQLTPEELDEFLAEARTVGDEWIAAGERESG